MVKVEFFSFIFAILFYALISLLAMGSMIGTLEGVLTPVADFFQNFEQLRKIPKKIIMLFLCIIHFAIGIIFTTRAGTYWLDVFNDYSANLNLLAVGLCQYLVIYWGFGTRNWISEIKWMIGKESSFLTVFFWYITICAKFISPVIIIAIFVFFAYDMVVSDKFIYRGFKK